mgnify:CR=1 FL=1
MFCFIFMFFLELLELVKLVTIVAFKHIKLCGPNISIDFFLLLWELLVELWVLERPTKLLLHLEWTVSDWSGLNFSCLFLLERESDCFTFPVRWHSCWHWRDKNWIFIFSSIVVTYHMSIKCINFRSVCVIRLLFQSFWSTWISKPFAQIIKLLLHLFACLCNLIDFNIVECNLLWIWLFFPC